MRELSSLNEWSKLWDASYSIMRWKESETVKNASKEELQIMDNVKFSITVILMLLDPTYDQPKVSSSKVQECMGKWDSDVVIQRWLKCKSPLEDDNIMDNDMISRN
ncbi:hypothetical protein GLOIN_2v1777227 [Rhizophagus irregularis DAOM 181602=DAOM 197198]|uniref:Uncharacterized protein n=1 Tax=Rhizophagus irregularis (strain DAOM 181602 / DAOM 197198 / MUCL 43194) TaxID=747089 RepID=A0A2P4PV72_RHIID|nr:hypothetical protein GLOIN_2v1777227 [Rhizophagus irregularis DAOM 181602=DAOM 197198]POG69282.1 hypothetical protein GLOIN_2v1777227 [Rhizophagus irregularis DAOM 181602=DAOM 197198]GBC50472.2 hypothetical protein GLOIN_2v1777227 [Rhizophagus irregularis DAOM 181602=DAOM 197198]|eukprot:XP_025176148.1 hypothetical protein GLOIN_2v1777227 [Rhizophagus irregularis DAOM 181602=DAOM 197198]